MNFFSSLIQFDHSLFLFLNTVLPRNIFFDGLFILLTSVGYLGFLWIGIAIYLAFRYPKKHTHTTVKLITANLLVAGIVELILKNMVKRMRPEFTLPHINVLFDPITTYSFPSGHAAAAFASVYILSKAFPKHRILWYILAFLISFSRIYLGKHYPFDVAAGALLGWGIGYLVIKVKMKSAKGKVTAKK